MSWYITFRGDDAYSGVVATDALVEFLGTFPELRRAGPSLFSNADGRPWVSIILASCDPAGGYATGLALPLSVNVVEMVCSDFDNIEWYEGIARRLASHLGWGAFVDAEERQV